MINEDELEELILRALGLTSEEAEKFIEKDGDTAILLLDKKGVFLSDFEKIVKMLLPFSFVNTAYLSDNEYQGFVDYEANRFILKVRVTK